MRIRLVLLAAFIGVVQQAARGDLILAAVAVSTDMGEFSAAANAINQSGLSAPYVSLMTDFDAYIASNPTADFGAGANVWAATPGTRSGHFDFDLGGTYYLSSLALWTATGGDISSIREFDLLLDDNPAFSSPTVFGTFTASNNLGVAPNAEAQVFTFAQTSASFVRMQIHNTHDPSSFTAFFNEAAFEATAIPEPSTLILVLLGCATMGLRKTRHGE